MTKVMISTLTGAALDYAVAVAGGKDGIKWFEPHRARDRGWVEIKFNPEPKAATARYDPSDSWHFAGPIIEREGIAIAKPNHKGWLAYDYMIDNHTSGPTPLIAAMRCYVASKFGDTIDIPEGLIR